MFGSTFGNIFKITTWGESHGAGIGVVIDGCPRDFHYVKRIFRLIWIEENLASPDTPPKEKNQIVWRFFPVFLKVKQPEPPSLS